MTGPSKIGWLWPPGAMGYTWNPTTGCTKVSAGCDNCYADDQALRLQKMGAPKYRNGFKFTTHIDALYWPLHQRKPGMVFVNSMSDLGHQDMPVIFFAEIVDTMHKANWHIYQILTKRPTQLRQLLEKSGRSLQAHEWAGASVEDSRVKWRIKELVKIPAQIHFLSIEPLIGEVGLTDSDLQDIEWVILGGESGPHFRNWPGYQNEAKRIRDLCVRLKIPFFYKQGPARYPGSDRKLDGRTWDEFPEEVKQLGRK